MANEFKHATVGTELTQTEWEAVGTHVFNSQATGDILYASSATQLSKLAIGTTNYLLTVSGGVPAWTATPTVSSLSMGSDGSATGDMTLYGASSGTYCLWDSGNETLDIYSKMAVATGTTAEDAVKINVTDASTISGNINRGLFVNYTSSGAKTGSAQVNCIAYDLAVTANCPDIYLEAGYLATIADKTIGNLFGISLYFEDFGNAVANFCMLDLGYNSPHAPSSRNCYIRCRQHHTVQSGSVVLQLEGAGAAESFLAIDTASNLLESGDITSGKSCTYGVRCKVGSTVFVLAGYAD